MASKYPGVTLNGKKLRITFTFMGEVCREQFGSDTSIQSWKSAALHRAKIVQSIEAGTFVYSDYFPESKKLAKFGNTKAKKNYTFKDVVELYLATETTLADSTFAGYKSALRSFWVPQLGERLIRTISYSELLKAAIDPKAKEKTYNNRLCALRRAYRLAEVDGIIENNPAKLLEDKEVQPSVPDPFEQEEMIAILTYMRNNYHPQAFHLFAFAFATGLRTSELLGLQWDAIDWNNGMVCVKQALVKNRIKGTKTGKVRHIELPPLAMAALEGQKEYTFDSDHQRVFCNPLKNIPYCKDDVIRTRYWHPALKALGLKPRKAYTTRQTFCSLQLSKGANHLYIKEQMGHGTLVMIDKHYGKYLPKAADNAEKAIAGNIFAALPNKTVPT